MQIIQFRMVMLTRPTLESGRPREPSQVQLDATAVYKADPLAVGYSD